MKSIISLKMMILFCYGNLTDRDVLIRDGQTLKLKERIKGHGGSPVFIQELSNGDIATISCQRAFRILRDYKEIYKIDEIHNNDVLGFYFDENTNKLFTYAKDNTIKKWLVDLTKNPLENKELRNMAICSDFKEYVLIAGDKLNIANRKNYKFYKTNIEHGDQITSVVKIDDNYFATASFDKTIRIFNIDTFKSILTLEFNERIPLINCVEIDDEAKLIYATIGETAYIIKPNLEVKTVDKKDFKEDAKYTENKYEKLETELLFYKDAVWTSDKLKEIIFIDEVRDVICIKDGKKSIKFLKYFKNKVKHQK